MRYGEAGQSHLLPFLGAAALFAALTITAHSLVLGLAAVIAGPVPAAQTALSLSRKAVSGAAQEAASVAEAAPESTGTAASQPEAAAPTGGIESYLVELLGDDARPEGAGAVIEKNYPQGSGEKYVACGAGSIKNNTRQTAADIAAEIQAPLPFGVEKDSPDPQILIMHTHATEDYRLSAGLWYSPGDGARTTDTNLNMCAVGRVMADTLNAAGLNTLHDETLNDYPSYTGSYENSRAVVQRYLAQYPSIKVVLDVHRDAIETEGGSRMAPVCTVNGRQAAHPFLLVDCIEELEPGVRAVGYKAITYDESFFRGHFPQEPVMPGVLMVEALAQTGAVAILSQEGFKGKTAYFGGIDKLKFKHKVVPGDRLRLECEIIRQKGPVGIGKATATVDGKVAVTGELTFMIG